MRCDRCGKETETLVKVGSENLCEECYTKKIFLLFPLFHFLFHTILFPFFQAPQECKERKGHDKRFLSRKLSLF